ncbi:hypothetical protein [Paenibacillus tengchongensis]|uniref:hypothetical protein n=1 Tax=Paenibacillus tengchongensis TaxID=2608684 RepID=UPI00124D034B|nr:hypothetical protein [Paenibacillus tengchongensis]
MGFEQCHQEFLAKHLSNRTGERKGRLERGHGHAEQLFLRNVWWQLRGDLRGLHPEYEVLDWRGRSYFADFAFLPGAFKLIFEIKGYQVHVKDMDRLKYSNELNRETFLAAMGCQVIPFAYDDVEQRPELCVTLLRMLLSRYMASPAPEGRLLLEEREAVRYMISAGGTVRPKDVGNYFSLAPKTVRNLLTRLQEKGWIVVVPQGQGLRNVRYELARNVLDYWE